MRLHLRERYRGAQNVEAEQGGRHAEEGVRRRQGPARSTNVRIDYKLYAVGDRKPKVSSSVKASSGGGFGFKSALKFAYFAGSMYFTMGMGGGMKACQI